MTRDSQSGIKSHEGRTLIDPSTPEGLYALTESGDFAAAEVALKIFCKSVQEGVVPPQDILEYLEDGFTQFLERRVSSIDEALTPTEERNRPKRLHTAMRNIGLAGQVLELMAVNVNLTKAIEQVAKITPGVSKKTIEDAYRKYCTHVT
jgi:hypothetical protein